MAKTASLPATQSKSSPKAGAVTGIPYDNPKDKAKVDSLERMILLRAQDFTFAEIGRLMGCTDANVAQRLKPYKDEIAALKEFQDNKAVKYDLIQNRLLSAINPRMIERAGLYAVVKAARDMEEMSRKVRGLDSIKSVSIFSLTVKAAHALPEGINGNPRELSPDPDGAGIREVVREDRLLPVQGVRLLAGEQTPDVPVRND